MISFADMDEQYSRKDSSSVWLQSIPYDGTSTWGKGADKAFPRFMEALGKMELYDIETDSEVYKKGVHILPELAVEKSPEEMFQAVYESTKGLLDSGKFLTFLGGEHSVSIGIIKAFYEKYSSLTVLQLDAHADLQPVYNGSPFSHACAVHDASLNANLIQVGIRSMDRKEVQFLDREKCWFAQDIHGRKDWMEESIAKMTDPVYITIDLDVFDPSFVPSTGTPEPGGLDWYTILEFLRKVMKSKNVLGFDIVELAPIEGMRYPDFLAAKLYYKILSYRFEDG